MSAARDNTVQDMREYAMVDNPVQELSTMHLKMEGNETDIRMGRAVADVELEGRMGAMNTVESTWDMTV